MPLSILPSVAAHDPEHVGHLEECDTESFG